MVVIGRSIIYDYSKDELQEIVNTSDSYADVMHKIWGKHSGNNYRTLHKVIREYDIDVSILDANREKTGFAQQHILLDYDSIFNGDIQKEISGYQLKKKLISMGKREIKCENCGLTEWLGQPMTINILQIHHINGDRKDNNENNLKILCPNCHALTDNYAGRNTTIYHTGKYTDISSIYINDLNKSEGKHEDKKVVCPICKTNLKERNSTMCQECWHKEMAKNIPDRQELLDQIFTTPFVKIGEKYGVTDKAVRKWCKKYSLPYTRKMLNEYKEKTHNAIN